MPTLVCLHGWGGDAHSFDELREALKNDGIQILSPDLPGFGGEKEPNRAWNNDDYANWVEEYIKKHVHGPFSLLGHSHGGRIAIKLVLRKSLPIEHLYLCASAGIRHSRHIKRIIGLTLAKTGRFFLAIPGLNHLQAIGRKILYKLVRVHDYENASPLMRQTLIEVTKEDFRPYLDAIKLPTDIFWGTEDRMTPFADGQLMHKVITGSKLHSYQGIRHRVHRDKAIEIAAVIRGNVSA